MRNRPNTDQQEPAKAGVAEDINKPPVPFDPNGHKDMRQREAEQRAAGAPHIQGGAPGVVSGPPARGPMVHQQKDPPPDLPPVRRYVAPVGGTYVEGGQRVILKAGKEVNDKDFDVAAIRRAGIQLNEVAQA